MPAPQPEPLLDVKAAAEILGVKPSWIYADVEREEPALPFYRLGRYIKFRASELEAFIQAQRQGNGNGPD